jgi:reverse gyrase
MAANKMTNRRLVFSVVLILILGLSCSAKAEDSEADHEVKQREKIIEAIEEKEEVGEEKIKLIGYIETNYEYLDVKDIDNKDSGSSSDLFIGSVTFALSAIFNEWSKALVALELEDIGRDGDAGNFRID